MEEGVVNWDRMVDENARQKHGREVTLSMGTIAGAMLEIAPATTGRETRRPSVGLPEPQKSKTLVILSATRKSAKWYPFLGISASQSV